MTEALLAIDAATMHGGVAVGRDGNTLAEVGISNTSRHSELLLPAIEFALHASGVARADLAGIVVGAGPGSFTGVRIAAATARGLAAALGVPLHAYSSLAALAAAAARGSEPVCAMFDARRGEVYAACYAFGDARDGATAMQTIMEPVVAHIDDVIRALGATTCAFAGDGAHAYAASLPREPLPLSLVHPRASALLWLAHTYPAAGMVGLPATFEPVYLRDAGAVRGLST